MVEGKLQTMTTIIFDIETDALLDKLTKIHCIAAWHVEKEEMFVGHDKERMAFILQMLSHSERIVAHNGIGFDIPAIKKIHPKWKPFGQVYDTMIIGRALWPDIKNRDYQRVKIGDMPGRLLGSHSLEAYGYRFGVYKGDYGKKEDAWKEWSQEMEDYCIQDVEVLKSIYEKQIGIADPRMIELELGFAELIQNQMERGVYFNEEKAKELFLSLYNRKCELEKELKAAFPSKFVSPDLGEVKVAKRKNKAMPGLEKGNEYCKIELKEFNPNSHQQAAEQLIQKYGWEPKVLTPTGIPQLSESILNSLDYTEAKLLSESLMLTKRIGMIADGNNAWLKLVKDNRIYGYVNTNGAVTGRCTHNRPNLAQVPRPGNPYGEECRELFCASPGMVLVGCDASGLELRCLGHYLARYDDGEYSEIILNGDIHTANQKAAGLPERNMAKTFIYAWLYGAGDEKIGTIVNGGKKEGTRLKNKFFKAYPQIKSLIDDVISTVRERNYLIGLDGRHMRTRSQHSALNMLLQGAGALVMKRALIEMKTLCDNEKLKLGPDYGFVLNVHDEFQIECKDDIKDKIAELGPIAIQKAGEYFNFRCPLTGESRIGNNWRDTH